MNSTKDFISVLNEFEPIDVPGLDAVNFLNRKDEKFMLPISRLPELLQHLIPYYYVLDIKALRLFHYYSRYFDTDDYMLYKLHHMGKLNRYKIRQRSYTDSNMHFLEVKFKNNKDRTIKSRLKLTSSDLDLAPTAATFIETNSPHQLTNLTEKATTGFNRITLVNKNLTDRCTIDLNLTLGAKDKTVVLDDIVIVEVKQERFAGRSAMSHVLKSMRVYEASFSKYCMAISACLPHVKHNRFKPIHLLVNKLSHQPTL